MKLILCTNRYGWPLRFLMWSRWSHSAILDETNGSVYDSTLWGGGVRVTPAEDFFMHYRAHELQTIKVAPERLEESRTWLREQLGKPYDWTALLSWVVRRDWQEPIAGSAVSYQSSLSRCLLRNVSVSVLAA